MYVRHTHRYMDAWLCMTGRVCTIHLIKSMKRSIKNIFDSTMITYDQQQLLSGISFTFYILDSLVSPPNFCTRALWHSRRSLFGYPSYQYVVQSPRADSPTSSDKPPQPDPSLARNHTLSASNELTQARAMS